MSAVRTTSHIAGGVLAFALLLAPAVFAGPAEDLAELQGVEKAARQKSLALLSVIKSMGPEFVATDAAVPMARIVSVSCEIREARSLESRVILRPNLNDEYEILDEDDNNLRIALPDGRTGWIDESHVQRFDGKKPDGDLTFEGADPQQLRRYAVVIDELLAGIDEDRERADALLARLLPEGEAPQLADPDDVKRARGAHGRVVEYHAYAHRFYDKYIAGYDFTLKNKKAFLENLSAWGELLMGNSKFTTTTLVPPAGELKDEVKEGLVQVQVGGEVDLNERSSVKASFANKKEVNQTAYTTTTLNGGWAMKWSETTDLDLSVDTYAYAGEDYALNDFRRTTLAAASHRRTDGRDLDLRYGFTKQAFEENDADDYDSHAFDVGGRWRRGGGGVLGARLLAVVESSDVAFHDFKHLTPSVEYSRRKGDGRTTWRALYEKLDYAEADLRSFGRAQVEYGRSSSDGPRSSQTQLSLAHKDFPDNELATYAQAKLTLTRTTQGESRVRNTLTTYTNFYPDNTDNNYTDLRLGRSREGDRRFLDVNLYGRIWHQPGEDDSTSVAKPYVADAYAHFGVKSGRVRFGPTLGAHVVMSKGNTDLEQDGNLLRVGARVEGTFALPQRLNVTFDASYDYGFVYSDEISIDTFTGALTYGEVVQRHPTTFQANAFVSRPLGKDLDFSARLTMYRIATDMDATTSINPITNNDRFTLFAGIRYRHN